MAEILGREREFSCEDRVEKEEILRTGGISVSLWRRTSYRTRARIYGDGCDRAEAPLEGFETLYPIGWDAFGLPTENFAIKHGIHPREVTKKNTDNFRRQMQSLGFSFDWSREINTTDPKYYRWTQWIFLQLFKKGLAYKQKMEINWCPSCKIGLANEEAQGGVCERCGGPTEKERKNNGCLRLRNTLIGWTKTWTVLTISTR